VAVALVAIGLTVLAGVIVGRSGGTVTQEATAVQGAPSAPPSTAGEPVARGGRLAHDDVATPPSVVAEVTEPPVPEVAAVAEEPAAPRPMTPSTTAAPTGAAIEPPATEDTESGRCPEVRGSTRGQEAAGSRRGAAACR
jgi:hypothetical protein